MTSVSARQQQVLDAAIEVLGTKGMRNLTHRAVDDRAGLPLGSTSNLFRTREALIAGVLSRLQARERAGWASLAGAGLVDRDAFVAALGHFVRELTGDGRVITLARHAIFVEASHNPALQEQIAQARRELEAWAVPFVAAIGSRNPASDLRLILSFVDGLLVNQLASPIPDFDPGPAIATLLRGMV
jgi:DNA-binding transcriptional regulator YbjK